MSVISSSFGNMEKRNLKHFFEYFNNLTPTAELTYEGENNNSLPFLDVLATHNQGNVDTGVYHRPTHAGKYINKLSNYSHHTKRWVIRIL